MFVVGPSAAYGGYLALLASGRKRPAAIEVAVATGIGTLVFFSCRRYDRPPTNGQSQELRELDDFSNAAPIGSKSGRFSIEFERHRGMRR
jgi:hypothetical protein